MDYSWYPHDGPQTRFCEAWEDEVLYGGAAGGGKTDCLIVEGARYIEFKNYHGLLARRTFPMLQEVIDRARKYYPHFGGEYKSSEHRWYFPSGAKISLGHCQHDGDEYNYQGKEFQFIGLDEAGQFLPKQILYLFSRNRSTDPTIPKRMRYASNPGGPAHQFLKDRFRISNFPTGGVTFWEEVEVDIGLTKKISERISRVFIPAKLMDNPTLLDNDPTYVARLMQLPEIERMRLLHGIWDSFEGQVFTELNREVHGIEPFDIPPEWPKWRAFDWGYSSPFYVGWWTCDFDGNLYLYREWYGGKKDPERHAYVGLKMTASEIAREIKTTEDKYKDKVKTGPADPSIWSKRRDNKTGIVGPSVAEEMVSEGINWIPADNDRILGKQQLHNRLRLDDDGKPRMYVFNNCEHFWRCLPEMKEHPKNIEDVDDSGDDHCYDTLRYFLMFRPMKPSLKLKADIGSFQSERRRYIKAKQYASRYGTSMDSAYGRVK